MSSNSTYTVYMPTRVIAGRNCITSNSNIFSSLGKKALIVTGARSAQSNGSLNDVIAALQTTGVSYLIFDRVMSNPTIACVYEGAELARKNQCDLIIAIGGGSPMDAGKAIALLAAQEIAEENLFSGPYDNKILPMALVPTTAGTGSEVTQYAILTNDLAQTKTSIAADLLFPKVAFLDARYTENLPIETTVHTAIDALSHAVEGMLSVKASTISNALAGQSIRIIVNCLPDLLQALQAGTDGNINPDIREQLLEASCLAGMVIAQTKTTAVHVMGYSLTYFKNIDHGRANGLLLGEYLRLVDERRPDLAARILREMKLPAVAALQELLQRLLGRKEILSPEEISRFTQIAMKSKNLVNGAVIPDQEDIRRMFQRSLGR